jgi:hypothetical protein
MAMLVPWNRNLPQNWSALFAAGCVAPRLRNALRFYAPSSRLARDENCSAISVANPGSRGLAFEPIVLISAQALLARLRQPRSRVDEVAEVRRRLRAEPHDPDELSDDERRLALELRELRRELSAALTGVRACASCARNCPESHGGWEGGRCCAGDTASLFDDCEIASLRAGGTTPWDLRAPTGAHIGCAFRGPSGCSLDPVDRPSRCVRYVCNLLARELWAGEKLAQIEALSDRIGAAHAAFAAAREERILDQMVGLAIGKRSVSDRASADRTRPEGGK